MNEELAHYIKNPDDPEANFALARVYHEQSQTASAVSYYLRCAERTQDVFLQYECLLHAALCFMSQEKRNLTVRGLLQHALVLCPNSPEAYWLLSRLYESDHSFKDHWINCYMFASLGMHNAKAVTNFRHSVDFPGMFALKFQRALSAWHCGLCDESRALFLELQQDSSVDSHYKPIIDRNIRYFEFDWGLAANNSWFKETVEREIFEENVYQRFVPVKAGDVVVDIGASVGPFAYSIKHLELSKLICVEPHPELVKTLHSNAPSAHIVNKAIGYVDGFESQKGLFNEQLIETQEDSNEQQVESLKFSTLVADNALTSIDFLKLDCEGGEYAIFTDDNIKWVKSNVGYIVGEWHLSTDSLKKQFRHFRDNYLSQFDDVRVFSIDGVDIKHDLHTDWFIEYYEHVNIYIDNRSAYKQPPAFKTQTNNKKIYIKDKWRYSISPTLEFTTVIPEKGCVVDCVFCPQRTLIKNYSGDRRLSLENFKRAVDKLPTEVRVTFAGFTEPWLNSDCTDMLLYAHERGHPISVFTTMVGVSKQDIERIKHIPFAGAPNGGFTVHLPDQERKAKHPITKKFVEAMEYLGSVSHEIQNFNIMSMGDEVHESVRHIFPAAPTYAMWSRAGNLIGERMLKPELQHQQFLSINHGNKQMTCGCDERLYHNIMLPNGDVSLCCMDYGLEEICGNLFESDYNDVIPNPYEVFNLCRLCENAIPVDSRFIKAERKIYNV